MESTRLKLSPNPCENANFLSKLFFLWTIPYYKIRYKEEINLNDVNSPLKCDHSEALGNRLEKKWNERNLHGKRNSLLWVLLRTFWFDYAFLALISFSSDVILRLGQPFLLRYLLEYFRADKTMDYHIALLFACGIIIFSALNSIVFNHLYHLSFHNGLKLRVAVCSLIYRKALRLSQTALGEASPGKLVNLLTNDVNRFHWAIFFMNSLWVSPLLAVIVGFLLWFEVGVPGLIGIFVVFAIVPLLSYSGKLTSQYRLQTALKTDERIRFMDEIISGVQVIKMYAWEKPFAKLIAYARKMEMNELRKVSYIRGIFMTSMIFTSRLAIFCAMFSMVLINGAEQITSPRIFAISSYFAITSFLMSQRFSRSIAETAEFLVALKRLENFFELDEKKTDFDNYYHNGNEKYFNGINSTPDASIPRNANISISMKNVRARWKMPSNQDSIHSGSQPISNRQPLTLNSLDIDFTKGKLIGVIGPVGCGKSSLLQAILRELPLESGSITIDGTISYASQEPWVFAASVRQNILFGQDYDRDRYNAVVKCCALQRDFEQFENGDLTIIGERGASVSGGQKARINLARACYRNADIYLLDDPLSAVDAHVGTHIFEKCIGPKGRLAKQRSTRILITHQVHFLKDADWLIVLKNGKVEMQGRPIDLYQNHNDFVELVGITETGDVENIETPDRRVSESSSIRSLSSNSSAVQDTKNVNDNEQIDKGVELEASSKGKVKGSVSLHYFRAGASWSTLFGMAFLFVFVQFLASAVDYWVSVWTKQEEMRSNPHKESNSFSLSTETCIYIQAGLIAALLLFGLTRSIGFYAICIRISRNIHDSMFRGIIATTMRFFDTNPSGRILNRFSKDLGAIDELQPKSVLDAMQTNLVVFGSLLVGAAVNPYFLLPTLVLSILFLLVRNAYLKILQNIMRLEGIAKSPAFTHLNATLNGLPTVRAFSKQEILRKEFDNLQDMHSACWFINIASTSVFGLSLDTLCTIYIACIIFYYMFFDVGADGANIGLAISQSLNLTGFVTWGIRQSAEVSYQMISVERLLEYRDLEPEKQPTAPTPLTKDWPSKGNIEFRNVFYRYFVDAEPVLRGLSFVVRPMEKIGIVGRTGAGKSSLIGSLFRLACVEGQILIDGIDTSSVNLDELRKHIAIIPQDPVLFSGTLRRNIDPFEEYSDDDIWSALESVELKSAVSDAFGLQSSVLPHGANYSVGERQLLCLARAILRKNRILVLDEATANVDPQTDLLIQRTIRTNFNDCTVLTVAHRLHTIIDSDRILVMDAGKAVEFDDPYTLLQNKNGIFYSMVNALGENEFERLTQLAYENSTATDL